MTNETPRDLVLKFYEMRKEQHPSLLRPYIDDNVTWREPNVGEHMGELIGVEAVIDMITRALATTGGTFSLNVGDTVETADSCAAVIHWSAQKDDQTINGREMAVFTFKDGKITFAQFLAENVANDKAFWS